MSVRSPISRIKETEPAKANVKAETWTQSFGSKFGALSHDTTLEAKGNLKQIKTIMLPRQICGIHYCG